MKQSKSDEFTVMLDLVRFVDPTKKFTVVNILSFDAAGNPVEGTGVAKRNPEDQYDERTGTNLAIKRALQDLADKFSEY